MEEIVSDKNVKKNNTQLKLILLISVTPIFLAYLFFFTGIGVPENTVNHGTLIDSPFPLTEVLIKNDDVDGLLQEKKWLFVIPVVDGCNQQCQDNLYKTRQVHIRLDKKSPRVARLALVNDVENNEILNDHPYLHTSVINDLTDKLDPNQFYLVDQQGVVMMAYSQVQSGNEILKDIKRAIKYSIDYSKI